MGVLDNVGPKGESPLFGDYLAEDDLFQTEFPGIFELLCRVKHKGKDREPTKLLVYYQAGAAALCLQDNETSSVCWHVQKTHAEAMEGLEQRIQHNELDWRKNKVKK